MVAEAVTHEHQEGDAVCHNVKHTSIGRGQKIIIIITVLQLKTRKEFWFKKKKKEKQGEKLCEVPSASQ